MIASLRGALLHAGKDTAVVDVGGVGYQVLLSARHLATLPALGEPVLVHTHLVVREDALTLVGFPSPEERELFLLLHGVSGVGAKTALGVLSALSVPEVVAAVVSQDPRALARAPGVGKKTAERIILELREKLAAWRSAEVGGLVGALRRPVGAADGPMDEAVLALLALGYGEEEAAEAIAMAPPGGTVEETIRTALAHLSRF
ncbi:MAG: Holliday junction branch migration protein RuvA [Candidatus Sericytochromatia bacterium]|nr:Holliday junction branch migration protein RuvA [Candidatus Sericytochromatia bacterium]